MGKDQKLVCVGKYPVCIKCPPFLTFVYPLQNKLIIKYAQQRKIMHFCYRRIIRLKQEDKDKTNYTRRHKFITHENNCCQAPSRSRNDQDPGSGFRRAKRNHLFSKPKPYSTTSYEHMSILTLGEL